MGKDALHRSRSHKCFLTALLENRFNEVVINSSTVAKIFKLFLKRKLHQFDIQDLIMTTIKHDISENDESEESLSIDDHQIMTMSVKELNTLLKSMKPNDAANIKRRRRILKNKGYAASSRHRQTSMVGNLSVERSQLVRQISQLQHENESLSQELRGWKQRYSDLQLLASPIGTVSQSTAAKSNNVKEPSH
ncbi:unnamed protein product [Rotaria magnacalcarata]